MAVMGDAGNIQVVVAAASSAADNNNRPDTTTPDCGELDPAVLGDCARSIVSYASSSIRRSTISYQQRQRRAQWKGIGSRCMWDACRATLFGILLLVSGCIVVLVGYYSEFSTMDYAMRFNLTVSLVDPESLKRQKLSYSYIGPVLIGIGVFVLIGVGVATMEMRDMTAKVFPLTKRLGPRRKGNKALPSQTKLAAETIGDVFQTSRQRTMEEMSLATLLQNDQVVSRAVGTQTLRRRSWRWSGLRTTRQPLYGKMRRSCQQLSTPSGEQSTVLPPCIFKRRRRYRYPRKMWMYSLADSMAVSCPQLDSVS